MTLQRTFSRRRTLKNKAIKKAFKEIIQNQPASIEAFVAQEALDYGASLKSFFKDVMQYGCVNGTVSSLIYYRDTHQFFDVHYDQIDEIRQEFQNATGVPLECDGDLKNYLAWFAFEQTAFQIASQFDLV